MKKECCKNCTNRLFINEKLSICEMDVSRHHGKAVKPTNSCKYFFPKKNELNKDNQVITCI